MSAETDTQDALQRAHRRSLGDSSNSFGMHRELVLPAQAGTAQGYLRLRDSRFEWLDLPFGQICAQARADIEATQGEAPGGRDAVLIPIIPVCYASSDRDPLRTRLPRTGGYIYVFVNGCLWREVYVAGRGFYRDVNLAHLAGRDVREPTGEADSRIPLPYKVDGELQDIELCYSEVQWSWVRINSMGGMAKDDPRIKSGWPPMPTDEQVAGAEELRALRMRRVDLSGYADGFPERAADARCAGIRNIAHLTHLHVLKWMRSDQIPVVELDDHLDIAARLAGDYQDAWKAMAQLIEDLQNPEHEGAKADEFPFAPWFDSALLANRYFFADFPDFEPEGVAKEPGQPEGGEREWRKAKEQRAEWQRQLSYDDIQLALGTERRKALRERIKDTKQALVEYLDVTNADLDKFIAEIDDFATLPVAEDCERQPCYSHLFGLSEKLVAKLGDHEYSMDLALETSPPDPLELNDQDIGNQLLGQILDREGGHPLHERLFPEPADGDDPLAPSMVTLPPGSPKADPKKLLATGQKGLKVVGELIDHFAKAADKIIDPTKTHSVLRLINSTESVSILGRLEYRLMSLGEYVDGLPKDRRYRVVSAHVVSNNEFLRDTRTQMRQRLEAPGDQVEVKGRGYSGINLFDRQGNLVGSTSAEAFRQGQGLSRKRFARGRVNPELGDAMREARVRVVVAADPGTGREAARHLRNLGTAAYGIYPIVLFVELRNFRDAVRMASSQDKWQDQVRVGLGVFGPLLDIGALTAGMINAHYKAASGRQSVQARPVSQAGRATVAARARVAMEWGTHLGIAAGAYSAVASHHSLMRTVRHGDDAAIAYGTITVGHVLSTAALVGTALNIKTLGGLGAAIAAGGAGNVLFLLAGGVWGLLGVVLVLAGYALLTRVFTEDTPLEQWLTNGPFSINGLPPRRRAQAAWHGLQRARVWRDRLGNSLMTSVFVRKGDGILLEVREHRRALLNGQRARLYLQGDRLFLRKGNGARPIGRLGEPFSFEVLEGERSQRFAGHQPGTPPRDDFGWWYERPGTAYQALLEAIYMPAADLRCEGERSVIIGAYGAARLTVHFPLLVQNQSRVYIELWVRESGVLPVGRGDWERVEQMVHIARAEVDGPQTVDFQWTIDREPGRYDVKAKLRMDLHGNGELLLPGPPVGAEPDPCEIGHWIELEDRLRIREREGGRLNPSNWRRSDGA